MSSIGSIAEKSASSPYSESVSPKSSGTATFNDQSSSTQPRPASPPRVKTPPLPQLDRGQNVAVLPDSSYIPHRPQTPQLPAFLDSVTMSPSFRAPTPPATPRNKSAYVPPPVREMMEKKAADKNGGFNTAPYMVMDSGEAFKLVQHASAMQEATSDFRDYADALKHYTTSLESELQEVHMRSQDAASQASYYSSISQQRGDEIHFAYQELNRLSMALGDMEQRYHHLLGSISDIQHDANRKISASSKEAEAAKWFVEFLQNKVTTTSKEKENTEQVHGKLSDEVKKISEELEKSHTISEEDKKRYQKLNDDFAQLRLDHTTLLSKLDTHSKDLKAAQDSFKALQQQKVESDKTSAALIAARDDLNRKLATTIDNIRKQQPKGKSNFNRSDVHQKRLSELLAQKQKLEADLQKTNQAVADAGSSSAKLAQTLEDKKFLIQKYQGQIEQLEYQNDSMKTKISNKSQEVFRQQRALEKYKIKTERVIFDKDRQIEGLSRTNQNLNAANEFHRAGVQELTKANKGLAGMVTDLKDFRRQANMRGGMNEIQKQVILRGADPSTVYGYKDTMPPSDPLSQVVDANLKAIAASKKSRKKINAVTNETMQTTIDLMGQHFGQMLQAGASTASPGAPTLTDVASALGLNNPTTNISSNVDANITTALTTTLNRTQDRLEARDKENAELKAKIERQQNEAENLKRLNETLLSRLSTKK